MAECGLLTKKDRNPFDFWNSDLLENVFRDSSSLPRHDDDGNVPFLGRKKKVKSLASEKKEKILRSRPFHLRVNLLKMHVDEGNSISNL
jgi:hypothetical protein